MKFSPCDQQGWVLGCPGGLSRADEALGRVRSVRVPGSGARRGRARGSTGRGRGAGGAGAPLRGVAQASWRHPPCHMHSLPRHAGTVQAISAPLKIACVSAPTPSWLAPPKQFHAHESALAIPLLPRALEIRLGFGGPALIDGGRCVKGNSE